MTNRENNPRWFVTIAASLIGPLLGLIASVALRFTTELTVVIVVFSLFMVIVVATIDFTGFRNRISLKPNAYTSYTWNS